MALLGQRGRYRNDSRATYESPVMKIDSTFLTQDGLMLENACVRLNSDPTRGVFYATFSKRHFNSLGQFFEFTRFLGPATQDWYSSGIVQDAVENLRYCEPMGAYTPGPTGSGSIHSVMRQNHIDVDYSRVPDHDAIEYDWSTVDDQDLLLVADCGNYWLDLFVADA